MSKIRLNKVDTEIRYANWIKMLIDLIKPTNLYLVGGRGVAKSTDIIAERMIEVIYDMPRSSLAIVADTYTNLQTNIIPAILVGWERKGFTDQGESPFYVVDKEPPKSWPRPYVPVNTYKHIISTFNGCTIFCKSLDRPSINAGISVAHIFGDEAKYLKRAKLNKALPTLRGDAILLAKSPFYMGQTFCTDMPNIGEGEDDWILDMEKRMDKKQIKLILQTALVVNDIRIELIRAKRDGDPDIIRKVEMKLNRWIERFRVVRQDSSFFYIVSSLANIDVLTLNYLKNQLESYEDFDDFKTLLLSIRTKIKKGARFYFKLTDKNFYYDGYNYDYYDGYGLKSNVSQSSKGLRYIQHTRPLEAGFDAGNMMSLVIFQDNGKVFRILKDFHTITPAWIPELAAQFLEFFKSHEVKVLQLHADRSTNAYNKAKQDIVSKLKQAIEFKDGAPTGWRVILQSQGARNVEHVQEYSLANDMFEGKNKALPTILIDAYECRHLKSSLELAPMEKVQGRIKKVKRSEKLKLERLPMESTNFSDAFKAAICQPKYLRQSKGMVGSTGDPKVRS